MIMTETPNCLKADGDLGRNGALNYRCPESCKLERGWALCAWQAEPPTLTLCRAEMQRENS